MRCSGRSSTLSRGVDVFRKYKLIMIDSWDGYRQLEEFTEYKRFLTWKRAQAEAERRTALESIRYFWLAWKA